MAWRLTAMFPEGGNPNIGAAMIPAAASPGRTCMSNGTVRGGPAVQIAVEGPNVEYSRSAQANMGVSRTADAPPWFRPSQYFEGDSADGHPEHAPVAILSDNQIPVPAGRPAGFLISDAFKTRKGGQRQIYQPEVVPVWLGLKGTPYG